MPGRLSVCWTFGDYEAKLADKGGNPNVVIAIPEIKSFEITSEHDFVLLGCDGIFDKMNNTDTVKSVWKSVEDNSFDNVHSYAVTAIDYVIKNSLYRKTMDNVTAVIILFSGFKHHVLGSQQAKWESQSLSPSNQWRLDVPLS